MMLTRIEQAQAQGRAAPGPTLDVAMSLSALAQGSVAMLRAGRFRSHDEFTASYRLAISRVLASLSTEPRGASEEL